MRRSSLKSSIKARTTGKWKRQVKRALIPGYGKKGMGWLHPKKALYNRVYSRTTFGVGDVTRVASAAVSPPKNPKKSTKSATGKETVMFGRKKEVAPDPVQTIAAKGKNRRVAALLAMFLGIIGAHKFYLGYWKVGLAYIGVMFVTTMASNLIGILMPFCLFIIFNLAECIIYSLRTDEQFQEIVVDGGRAVL